MTALDAAILVIAAVGGLAIGGLVGGVLPWRRLVAPRPMPVPPVPPDPPGPVERVDELRSEAEARAIAAQAEVAELRRRLEALAQREAVTVAVARAEAEVDDEAPLDLGGRGL